MLINDEIAELFNDSLDRCKRNPSFLKNFYARFFRSSPEIPLHFKATNMQRQVEMLEASFYMIMAASQSPNASQEYLGHSATAHQQRNISPHLYDLWLESLIATVAETDAKYDKNIENAWRTVMGTGIEYMKTHVNPQPDAQQ
ncbi:MAG TPA: globin [Steroidobacteraceae bacterium]|nr:globin [Steroidobacteraceae bacterium]